MLDTPNSDAQHGMVDPFLLEKLLEYEARKERLQKQLQHDGTVAAAAATVAADAKIPSPKPISSRHVSRRMEERPAPQLVKSFSRGARRKIKFNDKPLELGGHSMEHAQQADYFFDANREIAQRTGVANLKSSPRRSILKNSPLNQQSSTERRRPPAPPPAAQCARSVAACTLGDQEAGCRATSGRE